ncbi:hypothetical protein E1181_20110 [Saccharopolyspora terrae]|uniref:Uncharacterized protein n=1 Tax=Saccharopolyspora terrae TaxID=2530384 RepID=A0A4R4VKS4_9PSEU|nr:hypothetical protein [Saccharopolyspora terrae]TDD03513.1 hypothetical protein E1181_20110 [Saccharopolyspora terrae]
MREPIVLLVYERTAPVGVDGGVEPLIAVCATEEEAKALEKASAVRGRHARWEEHRLRGTADRTSPLVDGETVYVVLLGDIDSSNSDPTGIAVYTDRETAERHASRELHESGSSDYHAVRLAIGWRASSAP